MIVADASFLFLFSQTHFLPIISCESLWQFFWMQNHDSNNVHMKTKFQTLKKIQFLRWESTCFRFLLLQFRLIFWMYDIHEDKWQTITYLSDIIYSFARIKFSQNVIVTFSKFRIMKGNKMEKIIFSTVENHFCLYFKNLHVLMTLFYDLLRNF